eukprot:SAG31_NODE_887_length_11220_cov_9.210233_8_plen_191_part_00
METAASVLLLSNADRFHLTLGHSAVASVSTTGRFPSYSARNRSCDNKFGGETDSFQTPGPQGQKECEAGAQRRTMSAQSAAPHICKERRERREKKGGNRGQGLCAHRRHHVCWHSVDVAESIVLELPYRHGLAPVKPASLLQAGCAAHCRPQAHEHRRTRCEQDSHVPLSRAALDRDSLDTAAAASNLQF